MRNIIKFFIKRPVWGNAFIALVIIFGVFSIATMQRSFFPELDPKTVVVSVFYPGASPAEMEEGVTIKIEQAIKGLDGIDVINSTSNENFSSIQIKGEQDCNIEELLSDIENSVNSLSSFPQGAEKPIINRIKTGGMGSTVAFMGLAAKTKDVSIVELTDLASQVEKELLNTKEITEIQKKWFSREGDFR